MKSSDSPLRCVHLDLKGLPPTSARLLQLPGVFAAAKFNAMLVEWEDAFPWEVDPRFRSESAYSRQVIAQFHRRARELGLQVIPLVQCLGHMETVLSVPEYAPLRELADRFDCLNPLAPGAGVLVERMIDEVLDASGPVRYFHLGGDEVYSFGRHADTRAFIAEHGKAALYLRHVEPFLDKLNTRGIRPLLWHDMMHDWPERALARLAKKADLVAWAYHGDPDRAVIERLRGADVSVWGATAYKGADSMGDGDLPDRAARVANASGWAELSKRFELVGLVATAWSRYSTHRVQCEPMDGALDAMFAVAAILRGDAPANDSELREALRQAGELERFEKCRSALARFSDARRQAWQYTLIVRQQRFVGRADKRRENPGIAATLLDGARDALVAVDACAGDVRAALRSSFEDVWIDRYLAERIGPLREELAALA
jgi:hexosaminidase